MTVLPAGISQAAANTPAVSLSGISLVLEGGKTVNATKVGDNNFSFDLSGDAAYGKQKVQSVVFTSPTAVSLSVLPANFDYSQLQAAHVTKDDYDIQFVNGQAVLDSAKLIGWANRVNKESSGAEPIPVTETPDYVFTFDDFKSMIAPGLASFSQLIKNPNLDNEPVSPYVITGYLTDKDGKQSTMTLTVKTEGWSKVNSKRYYFNEDGTFKTGWFKDAGKWYYLNPNNGAMATGWAKVNGKWYYLDSESGAMKTGWAKVSNKWYYLDANGTMKTGWVKVSNKWYYLDANGAMKTGWAKVSNNWYYLDANGAMATGWEKISGKWYYFDTVSGVMKTGWVKISNKWYYFYSDGHMK